jgi:CheY-like chemotaxis protein
MEKEKESILVVEDEDILRESLVEWFASEDHKVDGAADGDQALERFRAEDYDAMIIDLKLPGRDGLSVLKEVKVKNPKLKVVIITAYPSIDTAVEAMRFGAVDYVPKPFELDRLVTSIRSYPTVETAPLVAPEVEEKTVSPCIWMQSGIFAERMCTLGYQCDSSCKFHTGMMKKEKYREDARIQPYLEKLAAVMGKYQCRYTLDGETSFRSCPRLYNCERCEYHQIVQDEVDQQLALRAARRKRRSKERFSL